VTGDLWVWVWFLIHRSCRERMQLLVAGLIADGFWLHPHLTRPVAIPTSDGELADSGCSCPWNDVFARRALVEALQYHSRWCVLLSPQREDRRRRKHEPCREIHVSHCLLHNGSFDLISTMDSIIIGEEKHLRWMNRNFRFVPTQFVGIHTTKLS
jgi:hypothetical protein